MSNATKSLINRIDLKEVLTALIEEKVGWHIGNLKAIARNIAQAAGESYDDSYERVSRLLFIESDTYSLIHAAKSAGAIEEMDKLAGKLDITLAISENLADWARIVDPSE